VTGVERYAATGSAGTTVGAPPVGNGTTVQLVQSRIYVSGSRGAAGATGSRDEPLSTISAAVTMAATLYHPATGYPDILIEGGSYAEQVTFNVPLRVFGSLDGDTWQHDVTQPTTILAPAYGTWFESLNAPARLRDLEFVSGDAGASGNYGRATSSRAVYISQCNAALNFRNCVFRSGQGGRGVDGWNFGSPGVDALSGFDGQSANLVPYEDKSGGIGGPVFISGQISGGAGGDGTAVTGGNSGGWPLRYELISGFGFWFLETCADPGDGGSLIGTTAVKSGSNGESGPDGASGLGGTTRFYGGREFSDGRWESGAGDNGTSGENGCGGAGGGSGTGFAWWSPFPPTYFQWDGGGGGGGGAGGTGGDNGVGGTNGGGSFAVQMRLGSAVFKDCVFQPGRGGQGGRGGEGWAGGIGGQSGQGGSHFDGSFGALGASVTLGLGAGGDGGRGGDGGHGGGGGGGHGGPSHSIFLGGNSAAPGALVNGNTFLPGAGGVPGPGGFNGAAGSIGPDDVIK
ncbi:MAG: hypothetical protein AAGG01_15210, partial [Planctomycetota bacterium]